MEQKRLEEVAQLSETLNPLIISGKQWLNQRKKVVQEIITIQALVNASHDASHIFEQCMQQKQRLYAALQELEDSYHQALNAILKRDSEFSHKYKSVISGIKALIINEFFWNQNNTINIDAVYESLSRFSKRLNEIKPTDDLKDLSIEVNKLLNGRIQLLKTSPISPSTRQP